MKLLVSYYPYADETFYSYSLRQALGNGYNSAIDIYRLVNIKYRKNCPNIILKKGFSEEQLSIRFGANIASRLQLLVQQSSGKEKSHDILAFGKLLSSNLFISGKIHVCPQCLVEYGYLRNSWLLYHVTTCPFHDCLLINNCPLCGIKIGKHKDLLISASCGHRWDSMDIVRPTNQFEMFYSKMIHERIMNIENEGNEFGFPKEFRKLSLSDVFLAVNSVLTVMPTVRGIRKKNYLGTYSIEHMHKILTDSIRVFSNWPHNFILFLSEIQYVKKKYYKNVIEDSSIQSESSIMKLVWQVGKELKSPNFDFIVAELKSFITKNWRGNIKLIKAIEINDEDREYGAGWELLQKYRISYVDQKRLISTGILDGTVAEINGKDSIKISFKSIEVYLDNMKQSISLKEAGEILGISDRAVLDLINHKCLIVLRGPSIDGFKNWKIDRGSVQMVLDRFCEEVNLKELSDNHIIPFRYSWMTVGGTGFKPTIGRVVYEVINERLHPCKISPGQGLMQYWFAKEDMKNVFFSEIVNHKLNKISCSEAARKMRISVNALKALIKKGVIAAEKTYSGYYEITYEELEQFNKKFITLNEILKSCLTNSRTMICYLRDNGLQPLFDKSEFEYLPYIFVRNVKILSLIENFKLYRLG